MAPTIPSPDYGDWLDAFAWHHFVTLTARHMPKGHLAWQRYYRWVRRLEQRAQNAIAWFAVLETSPAGQPHFHALVANTQHLSTTDMECAWKEDGYAEAVSYKPQRGAPHYITKTLQGNDDYKTSKSWPAKLPNVPPAEKSSQVVPGDLAAS